MNLEQEVIRIAEEAKAKLMEHCDSVQIFVTKHDGGESETASYETGGGNFMARYGQISEWLEIQRQYQRNYAIRKDSGT